MAGVRAFRYRLRAVSARLLPRDERGRVSRVAKCGRTPLGATVALAVGKGGAYFAGVETCGSIWACPVCAAKIAERRRGEVAEVFEGHAVNGGEVYLVTLTVPHAAFQFAAPLREGVAGAWRQVISGAPWGRLRKRLGVVGWVRALEVTHGAHGWHPHLHVALLTKALSDAERVHLRAWLFWRWRAIVERAGLGTVSRRAFLVERAEKAMQAGEYVVKWGADSEIAKAVCKVARGASRSPWQLLKDADKGDGRAAFLFREYAAAFKGARHLTWSKGLRERYIAAPELSDEDIARADAPHWGDAVIGELRRSVYQRVAHAGALAAVLQAAEAGGWSEVLRCLRGKGLALPENLERSESEDHCLPEIRSG